MGQKEVTWSPVPVGISVARLVSVAVWLVIGPTLGGIFIAVAGFPQWVALIVWWAGIVVIFAVLIGQRVSAARPYREALAAARSAAPGSVIYAIRLDPLTTPVGVEWGDSRDIRWGFIRASAQRVEIVRSDGMSMLDRSWDEIELFAGSPPRLLVEEPMQEWWIPFISESGVWPARMTRRFTTTRVRALLAARSGR